MEIYLFRGFSPEEIEKGKATLAARQIDLTELLFIPVSEAMMNERMEELLNRLEIDPAVKGEAAPGLKTVIMATGSQEKALQVMRAIKAVLADPAEPAFAMVTQTSLTWTLGYYMDHVHKEHDYMKTHNPANDPDMRKIN
ncbi:MAG: DUF3783 domain-containing protein [Spirochaetales bacterium]|nr:DUF3783 domain-containing protein [Spirochaetales bacterium]